MQLCCSFTACASHRTQSHTIWKGTHWCLASRRLGVAPQSVVRQTISVSREGDPLRSGCSLNQHCSKPLAYVTRNRHASYGTGVTGSVRRSQKAKSARDSAAGQEPTAPQNLSEEGVLTPSNGTQSPNTKMTSVPEEAHDAAAAVTPKQLKEMPGSLPHFATAILVLYSLNQALAKLTAALGVKFPSALIGMFSIIAVLGVLEKVSPPKAEAIARWFDPAILWIQRWLGCFYVPALAVLPLTIKGIPGSSLAKMLGVVAVGMPLTLLCTAQVASLIRKWVKTEMLVVPPAAKLPAFCNQHFISWGVVAAGSVAVALLNPSLTLRMSFPCLLAATMEGALLGSLLKAPANRVLHPIIVMCLVINGAAAGYGLLTGIGYHAALQSYLTKGAGLMGAGDFLMSFLGVIILSFAFKIYDQREVMVRHAAEILGACTFGAVVSMLGTALMCRIAGLDPSLTRSLIPRSITQALALPIAAQLGATASSVGITAAGVMLTGLLGANFGQTLLNVGGFRDPITRGLSVASSAHGLGTAAMAVAEPEALPFCALAYALSGIISTFIVAVPGVPQMLLTIAGS